MTEHPKPIEDRKEASIECKLSIDSLKSSDESSFTELMETVSLIASASDSRRLSKPKMSSKSEKRRTTVKTKMPMLPKSRFASFKKFSSIKSNKSKPLSCLLDGGSSMCSKTEMSQKRKTTKKVTVALFDASEDGDISPIGGVKTRKSSFKNEVELKLGDRRKTTFFKRTSVKTTLKFTKK